YEGGLSLCNVTASQPKISSRYTIGKDTATSFLYMRHSGIPIYPQSYDFYSFMVSLMMNPYFYEAFILSEDLMNFWSMLWYGDDISTINALLYRYHVETSKNKMSTISDFLIGLNLRCSVVPRMV